MQILWINLVTDSLPALALSVDPAGRDIMERKPIAASNGIMQGTFLLRILLQGLMIAILSLAAFWIGIQSDAATGQTMTFAVLAFSQIIHVFNVRSSLQSAFATMFTNKLLLVALAIVTALMLLVFNVPALHKVFHLVPLNNTQWLWIGILSLAPIPIVEIVKVAMRKFA